MIPRIAIVIEDQLGSFCGHCHGHCTNICHLGSPRKLFGNNYCAIFMKEIKTLEGRKIQLEF